eukprot:Lithocolla_globosa_v1_NODE_2510_length_1968_cov_96.830110.p2 type:complete len:141 gc:universal NODE_2510_length_1968_cov_96.830110:1175-1597(+)
MVLAGLWFGEKKPNFNVFAKPLRKRLEKYLNEGFPVKTSNGDTLISRGFVLAGIMDLPAKSLCQNFVQFNGYYGCSVCKQHGKHISHIRRVWGEDCQLEKCLGCVCVQNSVISSLIVQGLSVRIVKQRPHSGRSQPGSLT